MSRSKKIMRNIAILAGLFFLFLIRSGLYLSPLSAHEHSERSIHYGPSEVVHVEDFDGGKYILSKYDRWFSCDTVNRTLLFFWGFGDQASGFANDKTKAVVFSGGQSSENYKVYGIINDDRVKTIEIALGDGNVLTQSHFYDNLFLITWTTDNTADRNFKKLKGYDAVNKEIFESDN